MALSLVPQDATIRTSLGQAQDGQSPSYAAPVDQTAKFLSFSPVKEGRPIDVSGAASTEEINRIAKTASSFNLRLKVVDDNQFDPTTVGKYLLVEWKPKSSLGSYDSFAGVVSSWTLEVQGDQVQAEVLSVVRGE